MDHNESKLVVFLIPDAYQYRNHFHWAIIHYDNPIINMILDEYLFQLAR